MDVASETPGEVLHRPRESALDRFRGYVKLVEGWGKIRRLWLSKSRPGYVARMKALRRGQCLRCGSCCSIAWRCPHLVEDNHCSIYDTRYEQCGHFPIDHRDLRYRQHTCGHYFVHENGS